ncbi:MAG: endonuclease [Ignavibacteriae bacterium HGW-Ignavibacteriae-3]|nr:MAG: endonuclease [Ignavibacteriae bacterium HGW-Ignavibacteriae-3]
MNNIFSSKFVQMLFRRAVVFLIYIFFLSSLTFIPLAAQPTEDLRVMTFNIRYGTANDGENSWQFRKDNVVSTIKNFKPDILGLQEALKFQLDEMLSQMPEYNSTGVGRDDGKNAGEYSCIFYLKDRFGLDSAGTFWFSETPEEAGSKNWGNNITRICSWALFNDKNSDKKFYTFNVHLDHESQPSREKSTELLINKINMKKLPVILTGDFNCGDTSNAIKTILNNGLIDSYRTIHPKKSGEGTFNFFRGETSGDKIDFVFTSGEFSTFQSEIVRTSFYGKFPSDHFPVTAILTY